MEKIKVCLVGGQPVPNLLSIKHHQPDIAVLVSSKETTVASERLQGILEEEGIQVVTLQVDPYDVLGIRSSLERHLSTRLPGQEVIINVTGTQILS